MHQADSEGNENNRGDLANNLFFTNLLSSLPNLDSLQNKRFLTHWMVLTVNIDQPHILVC